MIDQISSSLIVVNASVALLVVMVLVLLALLSIAVAAYICKD